MIRTWLLSTWDSFRTSFWFIPTLLTLIAVLLAGLLPRLDGLISEYVVDHLPWLVSTPASARSALSAMAGAMVTVSGVVLSITVVALSMTSSQYGPRLLRNFMSNTSTQFALGMFIATSMYCLLVLREVRGGPESESFVPHLSVSLGVLSSVFSIGVLIYFIHEVSMSVQAPRVVQQVAQEIDSAIDRLYPETLGQGAGVSDGHGEIVMQLAALGESYDSCRCEDDGYLQALDPDGVLGLAKEYDIVIHLLHPPGGFLVRDAPLAHVWPVGQGVEAIEKRLNDLIIVGNRRTPRQDVKCAILEMVEVAVRALSPGINDPFTAMNCVDRLAASLFRLASRKIPSPFRRDEDGRLRVIAESLSFEGALNAAFDQIRRHGTGNVAVTQRLLAALEIVVGSVQALPVRKAVLRQVKMIRQAAQQSITIPEERESVRTLCDRFVSLAEIDHDELRQDSPVSHTI